MGCGSWLWLGCGGCVLFLVIGHGVCWHVASFTVMDCGSGGGVNCGDCYDGGFL